MKRSAFDTSEIKEKLVYYVLSVLRNETDPTDDRLKEIISEVAKDNGESLPGTFRGLPRWEPIESAAQTMRSLRGNESFAPFKYVLR